MGDDCRSALAPTSVSTSWRSNFSRTIARFNGCHPQLPPSSIDTPDEIISQMVGRSTSFAMIALASFDSLLGVETIK